MTPPDVPLRLEFSVEVPGTPEQVWAAIATADGISSWFLPTDVEPRLGGTIVTHMGDTSSTGRVTGWEPAHRFAYEEPGWAASIDHPEATVTPLVSEFLIEAQSGGTCVVRVVSSAFGTGADWEQESLYNMARYWRPYFEHHLRQYLGRFAGQRATTLEIDVDLAGQAHSVRRAIERELGITEVGQALDVLGVTGRVERVGDPYILVSVTDPVPGFLSFSAMDKDDIEQMASAQVAGWLFGADAPAYVERETSALTDWLKHLTVS